MVKNKNKNKNKLEIISFAVNFCAVFSLIYIVALLLIINVFGGSKSALANLSQSLQGSCSNVSADSNRSAALTVLFPVSVDDSQNGSIKVVMDDAGYAQKKLDITFAGPKMIEITNKGINPHSFVIDGLKIDSGAINSGQTATIALESLSKEIKNYTYYSNIAGDDKEIFNGIMGISK
jgi:hypothetical protein